MEAVKFDNQIVEQKKEEMEKGNAYVVSFLFRLLLPKLLNSISSFKLIEKMLWKMLGEELSLHLELTISRKKMIISKPITRMYVMHYKGRMA